MRIGGEYESAGHYLVMKSLEMVTEDGDHADIARVAIENQDICYVSSLSGVDAKTWHRLLQDDLLDLANEAKFSQHTELRQQLIDTGNARIVFVCASDSFLGSGCDAETLSQEGSYRGKNWLGKSLMKLRKKFQDDESSTLQGGKSTHYTVQMSRREVKLEKKKKKRKGKEI